MRETEIFSREEEIEPRYLELTDENANLLGKAFWNLVEKDRYILSQKDHACILGVSPEGRKRLASLKKNRTIPKQNDCFVRVGHFLGIHKSLRILYPYNREIIYNWFNIKMPRLRGLTPIDFIRGDDLNTLGRLFTVRRMLDLMRVSND